MCSPRGKKVIFLSDKHILLCTCIDSSTLLKEIAGYFKEMVSTTGSVLAPLLFDVDTNYQPITSGTKKVYYIRR